MSAPTVVILAAGQGTRMRSALPKVLHSVCGVPLILWPVRAALAAGAGRIVVVTSPEGGVESVLPDGVAHAIQPEARGTGDAVRAAAPLIDRDAAVIVLAGDVPLITPEAIAGLVAAHAASSATATMLTMELDDPAGYGRVVRAGDGSVERVVETKAPGDATDAQLAIREVNSGIFAFDGARLLDALDRLTTDNAQGEYYLPEVLTVLRGDGDTVAAHVVDDPALTLGVNDRVDLAAVTDLARRRIIEQHQRAGVTVVDPGSSLIEADVVIGQDTVVEPSTFLRGGTTIGERCTIGPLTTLIDCEVAAEVTVLHSYLVQAAVADGVSIGPFAYLRPGTRLAERSKVGTFVEIKNSNIGPGSKVPHLSYIGDADVGAGSNLGASTITANYDGRNKHRTTIGDRVHGGIHVSLIAPVTLGDDAWTAAGSAIGKDVPDGALGVARARQENIDGYDGRTRG